MNYRRLVATLACSALAASTATAEVADILASRDNTLYEDGAGSLSNGAGAHLFVGMTDEPNRRRALLQFDIAAAIPAGSTIDAVNLTLNMSRTIAASEDCSLHRVLADWGEGPSDAPGREGDGAASEIGDATWIHTFYDTAMWGAAGGDYAPTASAVISVGDTGPYTWSSSPDMVADVQGWLDDPGGNFGWLILGNEATAMTAKRFDSRENSDPAVVPMLSVTYTPGGVGPTIYESASPEPAVILASPIGTAAASPHDFSPVAADDLLFYKVQDGGGSPEVFYLTRQGSGLRVTY